MHPHTLLLSLIGLASAARPFLNEPNTGIEDVLGDTPAGTLPPLESMAGLHDFDWAARRYMNASSYAYYSSGAAGDGLTEIFSRCSPDID